MPRPSSSTPAALSAYNGTAVKWQLWFDRASINCYNHNVFGANCFYPKTKMLLTDICT